MNKPNTSTRTLDGGNSTTKNEQTITKLKKTMTTHAGTLYEGDIVKVVRKENGDYRVTDDMGKIWYVPVGNLVELKN